VRVAYFDTHRNQLTIVGAATLTYGLHDTLHGALFAGGVGQKNAAFGLFLTIGRLDYYAVGQRSDAEVCTHVRVILLKNVLHDLAVNRRDC
jgi:hypothetical protein